MTKQHDPDFDFEPMPGLPAMPPEGERVLWQGSPHWKTLANSVFHVRWIGVYFALLATWRIVAGLHDGRETTDILIVVGVLAGMAAVTVAFFVGYAWAIGRTTVYTLTTRRLVMRFGVALPMTINVPFTVIEGAGLKEHGDGVGDVALTLGEKQHIAYAVLWPHARPWRLSKPEPMLRAIPNAKAVAALMADAFAKASPGKVQISTATLADAKGPAIVAVPAE
jgi:hypothetical protein